MIAPADHLLAARYWPGAPLGSGTHTHAHVRGRGGGAAVRVNVAGWARVEGRAWGAGAVLLRLQPSESRDGGGRLGRWVSR